MVTSSKPPILITKPLLNSIPDNLVDRFEPTFVQHWNRYNAGRLNTHQVPIEDYRKDPMKYTIAYGREIIDEDKLSISEGKCAVDGGKSEIAIRIFQLKDDELQTRGEGKNEKRPVYVNFHGGGWVFGGLATDHDFCKRLVLELGCVAFDVDYRLAPEYKFPVAVEDCWATFNWVSARHSSFGHMDALFSSAQLSLDSKEDH